MLQLKSLLIYCQLSRSGGGIQLGDSTDIIAILLSIVWKDVLATPCNGRSSHAAEFVQSEARNACYRNEATISMLQLQGENEGLPIPRHQRRHIDYNSNWLTHSRALHCTYNILIVMALSRFHHGQKSRS
jgi:hypothetical protein